MANEPNDKPRDPYDRRTTDRRRPYGDRRADRFMRNITLKPRVVKEVFTAIEAARYLRVSRNTLYDAAARGEIPCRRLGKRMIFSKHALVNWLMCNVA